jgi:hypothetical protein
MTTLNKLFDTGPGEQVKRFLAFTYNFDVDFVRAVTEENNYEDHLVLADLSQWRGAQERRPYYIVPYPDHLTFFHPKVYLIDRGCRLDAVFGSLNFTPDGFCRNYELSVHLSVDRSGSTENPRVVKDLLLFCSSVLAHRSMPPTFAQRYLNWLKEWRGRIRGSARSPGEDAALCWNLDGRTTLEFLRQHVGQIKTCQAIAPFGLPRERLQELLGVKEPVSYHNVSSRFYADCDEQHAKAYFFETTEHRKYVLIGSQNATYGGFRDNVELGIIKRLKRRDPLRRLLGELTEEPSRGEARGAAGFAILWAEVSKDFRRLLFATTNGESQLPSDFRCRVELDDAKRLGLWTRQVGDSDHGIRFVTLDDRLRVKVHDAVKRGSELYLAYHADGENERVEIIRGEEVRRDALDFKEFIYEFAGKAAPEKPWAGRGRKGGRPPESADMITTANYLFADHGELDEAFRLMRDRLLEWDELRRKLGGTQQLREQLEEFQARCAQYSDAHKEEAPARCRYAEKYLLHRLREMVNAR